jgi:hypothetical protein
MSNTYHFIYQPKEKFKFLGHLKSLSTSYRNMKKVNNRNQIHNNDGINKARRGL